MIGSPAGTSSQTAFITSPFAPNSAPSITDQGVVTTPEETGREIVFADLTVTDPDSSYPTGFTLIVDDGPNYTRVNETITPDDDFNGDLSVPVRVNDGTADSATFPLVVSVTPVNDQPIINGVITPLTTPEDTSITVLATDIDITDPDSTVFTLALQPGLNYTLAGNVLTPAENFGINLSYFQAKADYTESVIGLSESNEESFSINLNYAMGKKLNLYAFLTYDDIDADIFNVEGVSGLYWNALTRDRITTAGIGISRRINDKSSIGLDIVSSDSKGDISMQTINEEDPFSPLKTDLTNARLHYDREVNDHWGYKIYAEYEKFSSQDWAIDGLGVDGLSRVLTMGEQSPDYSVWYFRVQASYRF